MLLEVVDYDTAWPVRANEVIAELKALRPGVIPAIDHMDSTSVPKLPANPSSTS